MAAALLLAACVGESNRGKPADGTLKVFAAASMTEVVGELAGGFEGVPVKTSFGSTSELARQVEDGAPADIFISASKRWVDHLKENQMLAGDYHVFARNSLVCVAPKDSDLKAKDPAGLLAALTSGGGRVAITMEGVPAGDYARQSLEVFGLTQHFKAIAVGQKDVRAVLHAVSKGEVAAGFVYATDAKVSDLRVLFKFDPDTHDPIEYYVAAIKDARNAEPARKFIEHLRGEKGRAVLTQAGFVLPKP